MDGANRYVFFYFFVLSTLPFYSYHSFTISFVTNYSNIRDGAEWDGTGRAATAMRDGTEGRRAGRGGGRRLEGGLAGNMRIAEVERQARPIRTYRRGAFYSAIK